MKFTLKTVLFSSILCLTSAAYADFSINDDGSQTAQAAPSFAPTTPAARPAPAASTPAKKVLKKRAYPQLTSSADSQVALQNKVDALSSQVELLRRHVLAKHNLEMSKAKHQVDGRWADKLILSGALNMQMIASNRASESSFDTGASNKMNLGSAQLNANARMLPWLGAYMSFNDSPGQPNTSGSTGGLEIEQAYFHVGDVKKSPFLLNVGKQFLPFAVYKHHPVTSSTTQVLDEYVKETVSLGYIYKQLFATVYMFSAQGSLNAPDADNTTRLLGNGGLEVGMTKIDKKFGYDMSIGYINNMAEAKDIYAIAPKTRGRVGNFAGHVSFNVYNVSFVFDASIPSHEFNVNDITFNSEGAKPEAFATEVRYHFATMQLFPSTIAVGYQWTKDGLFINLPKHRYVGSYTVYVNHYLNIVMEFMANKDYDTSDSSTYLNSGGTMTANTGTGRMNNTGIIQAALHF